MLASPSASHFSPVLFTGDGPYLGRDTWLNDAIVQCCTAVLNSITEVAKRCIFLGPITSHGWDDQEILQNLNNYYAACQDSIEFGLPLPDPLSFNIDYHPPNDRRHRVLKGNIGAKYVSGQYMNTEEIF